MTKVKSKTPILSLLDHIFIDGLSGMALGLFSTLIIGTITEQIGSFIGGDIGNLIIIISKVAKVLMGIGIGIGVACKFSCTPLLTVSAGVCGMVGGFASKILDGTILNGSVISLAGVGEPLGAFVAALVGIEVGKLVAGKTKMDIILTPLVTITCGSAVGILMGPPISKFMKFIGELINFNVEQSPILGGIIVSVLMGLALTLPISSAAIGVSLGLSGLAAGAATVGCCAQMVGFAVASYRENKFSGLVAQGVGTSMIQMPNIVKNIRIWIPATVASFILGPISSAVLKMTSNAVGSGMGTSGLVGVISAFQVMTANGADSTLVLIEILLMYFIAPAAISFGVSELLRKLGWIKYGDMKLSV